jgi:hypothetical protein
MRNNTFSAIRAPSSTLSVGNATARSAVEVLGKDYEFP